MPRCPTPRSADRCRHDEASPLPLSAKEAALNDERAALPFPLFVDVEFSTPETARRRGPPRSRSPRLPLARALDWSEALQGCLSACPDALDYAHVSAPFVVPTLRDAGVRPVDPADAHLEARCMFDGYQGSVYEIECRDEEGTWRSSVMKVPRVSKLCIMELPSVEQPGDLNEQLWLVVPCCGSLQQGGDQDFFHLCNRALGDQVLEIRNESRCSPAALSMAQLNGGDHQKWRLDSKSRLVSKLGLEGPEGFCEALCLDVAGARDERGSAVIAYRQNEKDNQQWQLEAVATSSTIPGRCRVVKVISQMAGGRALTIESGDQMCRDAALEVHYLARWSDEAGLVRLQRVVWNGGTPKGIIMERLGKQLGKGTGADNKACVLQDIRNGDMSYTAAGAASSLMPVAHVLRRLHRDGYAFNDLHDGNILCCLDNNSYKVIDLGSVTLTGHWVSQLGTDYDGRWSTNRDWRAFGVAFLGLVCGGRQLNLWDLVGTNACTKMHTGAQCPWSAPVPAGDPCVLPADVSSLLVDSGMAWTHTERLNIVSALVAMFAPCINDDDICKKLGVLAGGADH